jgi:8-oxo-dGTP pyrophosphatase MutT (NUDIX family)
MNSLTLWMTDHLARSRQPAAEPRITLLWNNRRIGDVADDLAEWLLVRTMALRTSSHQLNLRVPAAELAEALRAEGWLRSWRNEALDVPDLDSGTVAGTIERGAVRPLGILTWAVHLNARHPDGRIWIARRALSKATDPGLWDTLVGGLVAANEPLGLALERESQEEAGLPAPVLKDVKRLADLHLYRPLPEGFQRESVAVYDVILPHDLQPSNQDGEVDEIRLAHRDELLEMIQQDAFTNEAAWVLLAALDAQGHLETQAKSQLASLYQAPWALGARSKPGL